MSHQDDRGLSRTDDALPIVLVVDDDPDDRAITLRVLRKQYADVTCIEVDSGEAAMAYLRQSHVIPSITFMDLKMPGMNGIETLHRIRADKHLADAIVVIITNSSLESDRAAA